MTVTYSEQMSQRRFGNFLRLLTIWRGSIFKLIYREMIIFWILYGILQIIYRHALTSNEKRNFESVCIFFDGMTSYIPLDFILGFYVTLIVQRWWSIFQHLAWPDSAVYRILTYIPGLDDRSRLIRRSMVRWMNLSFILILRSCSPAVRKRFPSLGHIEAAGILHVEERKELQGYNHPSHVYWVPLKWCVELAGRARTESRVPNDRFIIEIVTAINAFRETLYGLLDYDWISVPLVYTQVVTLGVYSFFLATLFGRQSLDLPLGHHDFKNATIMSPIIHTTMQFLFYMGWLKVAESLINPLGEDDDDFELNWLVDRNIKYGYLVVDEMFGRLPVLEKDIFWDEDDIELPYTEASLGLKDMAPVSSTSGVKLTEQEAKIVMQPSDTDTAKPLTLTEKIAEKLGILSDRDSRKTLGSVADKPTPVEVTPLSDPSPLASAISPRTTDAVPPYCLNLDPPNASAMPCARDADTRSIALYTAVDDAETYTFPDATPNTDSGQSVQEVKVVQENDVILKAEDVTKSDDDVLPVKEEKQAEEGGEQHKT